MSTKLNDTWKDIFQSAPPTYAMEAPPISEILRTIYFLLNADENDTAVKLLDVISPLRKDVGFLNWKAMVENDAKKYIRAFETCENILKDLKNGGTYFNAGKVAYKANKLDISKKYLETAIKLMPDDPLPILDYAVTIATMGDFEKALDLIESIDTSDLDETNVKTISFNKGWHYIRKGNFKKGISLLHIGREINVWGSHARKYKKPMWDGKTKKGKTILIAGEAGIGDEVINSRFAKNISDRGMIPIMSTVHKNTSMLSSVPYLKKVIDHKDIDNEKWDYWAPCMDLPYILKIDETEIPSEPYLFAKEEYVNKWSKIIKTKKKYKIGICWMGNPLYELDLSRTLPIELFNLFEPLDVQLFSLQKDNGLSLELPKNAINLGPGLESWDDTMGAISNCDLIITSCTSVAHVAGALGKDTRIVIPLLPYYTWADMKKESYWYDSVKLYRQKEWKKWNEPFDDLLKDLKKELI